MKKLTITGLFLLICVSIGFAAENPVGKGSLMADGTVFFATGSGELYENNRNKTPTLFMATPEFGYFVAPGVMVGGMVEFGTLSWGNDGLTVFGLGPIAGYFFNGTKDEIQGSIYPYIKGGFVYLNASIEDEEDDFSLFNLVAMVGFDYMLSDEVALDARIMLMNSSLDDNSRDTKSGILIWIGAGFSFFLY
jgi:hypothetical protein